MSDNNYCEHHVIHVSFITDTLFELVLNRGDLTFTPGDCVALFDETGTTSRPYSISSGTGEDQLRFIIRVMPGGFLTTYLKSRKPGNLIKVSPPFGWFRPGQDIGTAPFVFIATGTGIAPFLSYCRSVAGRHPECCLYGVRNQCDAIGLDELRKNGPFYLAISREATSDHFHGRVTGLLDMLPLNPHIHYYICGLDTMVDDVTAWLETRDVDSFNVHREVFFNDSRKDV